MLAAIVTTAVLTLLIFFFADLPLSPLKLVGIDMSAFIAILLSRMAQLAIDSHPHFARMAVRRVRDATGLRLPALILIARTIGLLLKRPDSYYGD